MPCARRFAVHAAAYRLPAQLATLPGQLGQKANPPRLHPTHDPAPSRHPLSMSCHVSDRPSRCRPCRCTPQHACLHMGCLAYVLTQVSDGSVNLALLFGPCIHLANALLQDATPSLLQSARFPTGETAFFVRVLLRTGSSPCCSASSTTRSK